VENEFATINFESLDSLMADLGNMITTGPKKEVKTAEPVKSQDNLLAPLSTDNFLLENARKSVYQAKEHQETLRTQFQEEITSLKEYHAQKEKKMEEEQKQLVSQYEKRIADLEAELRDARLDSNKALKAEEEQQNLSNKVAELLAQVASLELTIRQDEERIRSLTATLDDEKEQTKQLTIRVTAYENENREITQKTNALMEDLSNRLRAKDQEVTAKIREIRELVDQKNAIEMDRNEIQVENISLKEENRTLKEKLRTAEEQVQMKAPPQERKPLNRTPTSLLVSVTEEVVFNEGEEMKDLANGVSELLASAAQSNPSRILAAMKGIVMIVRKHLDDAEEFEKTKGSQWTPEQKEKFDALQNDISDKLTALVVVAKSHASSKFEGSHTESMGKMETLATGLSNVVVRLLGGMLDKSTKNKELEVEDLPGFLDKQTNLIVHAIQTLLLVLKTPGTSVSGFVSAIDALVSAVTLLKNVCTHSFNKRGAFEGKDRVDSLLRSLAEGITKLLSFRESINSGTTRPANQQIAATAFEIAKNTKELVMISN